jgi:aminoglycoside 3-N-acetyltransferase
VKTVNLFRDNKKKLYTLNDVIDALKSVHANECDILFVHTDVAFGTLNPEIRRKEYLHYLYEALQALNVGTIVLPAFTFSFCNNEIYDMKNSRTLMGALNEYIRIQPGVVRTRDPLLSMIIFGKEKNMFENIGKSSLGKDSAYDILHKHENVKFLFFGAEIGECFTFVHYVEEMLKVPYRFHMAFTGDIIDTSGHMYKDTYKIYTNCAGVKPACFYYFENYLLEQGFLKKVKLGEKPVTCISEKDAYSETIKKLNENINYFLEKPFSINDLVCEYTKGKNGERVISC